MLKKVTVMFVVLVMLAGVGVGVYLIQQSTEYREKAAPVTTLSFNSQTLTPDVGQEFIVTSEINTAENQVVGVELYINFTPDVLELLEVTPGNFFLNLGSFAPELDNEQGKVSYILWLMPNTQPAQGTGTLATFRFKAKQTGSAMINYTQETLVGAIEEAGQNVLAGTTPLTLTITGPSATPTAIIAEDEPTVTTSPSPTQSGGGIGGGPSTSTPTSTLTPTSSNGNGDSGSTATNTPTSYSASDLTSVEELPDSGIAEVAFTSIGIGIFVLFIGLILAL